MVTKLVPKLEPVRECTVVPKETCRMVFDKPKVVKKPLMTVWCLDQSEEQLEESEKTSSGFLSSGRKTDLSELELDDPIEEELEIDELVVEQSTEDSMKSVTDEIESEITLEDEFVQFADLSGEDYDRNSLEYEFEETQTSPIITVGLAATSSSAPRSLRARQLNLPARIISPRLAGRYNRPRQLEVRRRDSRIGLPSLNFLRVRENNYGTKTALIGPTIPDFRDIDQNLFQTRF